jgi:PAS domain-containing protein
VASFVSSHTTASKLVSPVSADSVISEELASSEMLLATVAAEIMVTASAQVAPKRRRKTEQGTDIQVAELQKEVAYLRQQLEQERRLQAIQRATAEQARRVADCLEVCHDSLLTQINQPCFTLHQDGTIQYWNPAMARWTAQAAGVVQGTSLSRLVGEETGKQIERACKLALTAIESSTGAQSAHVFSLPGPLLFGGVEATRLTLLPRFRVPGCVEAFLILVSTPARRQ